MEFLLVVFGTERDVLIDGVPAGITNHLITLAPGTYTVSLDGDRRLHADRAGDPGRRQLAPPADEGRICLARARDGAARRRCSPSRSPSRAWPVRHYPLTAPLPPQKPAARYAFEQIPAPAADDDLFVCLTFSGGGTRAAAFSYGVLQKLRDTPIVRAKDGRHETLLDEVDCISSVSGGSFTAAYYALFGARIFQDYRSVFLDRNVEGELVWKAANPLNWPRLLSPYFSRIDLAAELYADTIFQHKTYADLLAGAHRPFIILNGTDLATGDGFEFTQDQFDLIGSDLAAAADRARRRGLVGVSVPADADHLHQSRRRRAGSRRRRAEARCRRLLRRTAADTPGPSHQSTYLDKGATPYVHVMDGGLADNIGLRALERQLVDPTGFVGAPLQPGQGVEGDLHRRRFEGRRAGHLQQERIGARPGRRRLQDRHHQHGQLQRGDHRVPARPPARAGSGAAGHRGLQAGRAHRERLSQLRGAGRDSRRRRQPRGDRRSGAARAACCRSARTSRCPAPTSTR